MIKFDECESCNSKTTTTGCFNCSTFKLKSTIKELDEFIEAHKSNLSQFILYINSIYYPKVKSVLNLEIIAPELEYRVNSAIENDVIFIMVDKQYFDWGDIYLEMGEI